MSDEADSLMRIFDAIAKVNKEAYRDVFMISNSVLNKNPFNNNLFKRYSRKEAIGKYPFCAKVYKLLLYYIKSTLYFGMYLIRFFEFVVSGFKFDLSSGGKELVLIDVPFLLEDIAKSSAFRDRYLPGLEDILKKRGRQYAYLPLFYSQQNHKRPLELLRALRILKRFKIPLITEYQMFSLSDIFKLIFFILTYPFHVIRCADKIQDDTEEGKAVKYELMDTLDQATFYNYSRLLLGRRIARMRYAGIKVISWYENRPTDKNLYKGLRDGSHSAHIRIYGAQLFLYSKKTPCFVPHEDELDFGVLPDKILANGPYYIQNGTRLNHVVGPSLRYAGIFAMDVNQTDRTNILILLPYFIKDAEKILKTLASAAMSRRKFFIKAHPATPLSRFKGLLPASAMIVRDDIFKLFRTTKILIGAASGTMIEAASVGIPVIAIKSHDGLDINNPMPEYGRGIIWDYALDAVSLNEQIKAFEEKLATRAVIIRDVAAKYKDMFFSRPTESAIVDAFEL